MSQEEAGVIFRNLLSVFFQDCALALGAACFRPTVSPTSCRSCPGEPASDEQRDPWLKPPSPPAISQPY